MLKMLFDAKLQTPEELFVQPKSLAGAILDAGGEFFRFVRTRDLVKNEGLILRHLLRLVILAEEFHIFSSHDPDYSQLGAKLTAVCKQVDPDYTDRFLSSVHEARELETLQLK